MTENELKARTKLFSFVEGLLNEANELTAIFVASRISAKNNKEIANRQSQIAN